MLKSKRHNFLPFHIVKAVFPQSDAVVRARPQEGRTAKELMPSNCVAGEYPALSREDHPKGNNLNILLEGHGVEPILLPDVKKSRLIEKNS